jgi:hypothetical protein
MPTFNELPDLLLAIYCFDDTVWPCDPADEKLVRGIMREHFATQEDMLIDVTLIDGSEMTLRASNIAEWRLSTSEHRRRSHRLEEEMDAEGKGDGWREREDD